MKKKPKQKLSPLQKERFLKIIVAAILSALLWAIFAPNAGILALLEQRSELHHLQQDTVKLEQENKALQSEVEQLSTDPVYLEKIARKDYGLLKKNEHIFDFSKKQPEKKE